MSNRRGGECSEYATLKAIGYPGPFLARVVLEQALLGYLFQARNLLEVPTAEQNVAISARFDESLPAARWRARAVEMLAAVGLGGCAHLHPSRLSGGQRQRVAIVRAIWRGAGESAFYW